MYLTFEHVTLMNLLKIPIESVLLATTLSCKCLSIDFNWIAIHPHSIHCTFRMLYTLVIAYISMSYDRALIPFIHNIMIYTVILMISYFHSHSSMIFVVCILKGFPLLTFPPSSVRSCDYSKSSSASSASATGFPELQNNNFCKAAEFPDLVNPSAN